MNGHQQKQIEVIDKIEDEIKNGTLKFSTVAPVKDFDNDSRICLTSVHIPTVQLKSKIQELLIPLKGFSSDHYFYEQDSMHMTIKNVRVINDPPHFTAEDIEKTKQVFSEVIPKHSKFNVYFYRLLLFPNNLALIGTTDPELDKIILDLDQKLKDAKVPDDKNYTNSNYFFSNMTLLRFSKPLKREFLEKIDQLSNNIQFEPYTVDSVSLVTCNAVFKNRDNIQTWSLQ